MRYEAASYGAIAPTLRFFARTFADASASDVAWRIGQTVNARDRIQSSYCCPIAAKSPSFVLIILTFMRDLQAKREPTSGLEPLTCSSYECAVNGCSALQRFANPA
jgi:hypothetical protein